MNVTYLRPKLFVRSLIPGEHFPVPDIAEYLYTLRPGFPNFYPETRAHPADRFGDRIKVVGISPHAGILREMQAIANAPPMKQGGRWTRSRSQIAVTSAAWRSRMIRQFVRSARALSNRVCWWKQPVSSHCSMWNSMAAECFHGSRVKIGSGWLSSTRPG